MPRRAAIVWLIFLADTSSAQPPSDPLPPGAVARFGSSRFRVDANTKHVFLNPTGDTIVEVTYGGKVRLWSVETGTVVHQIDDPDLVECVADLSPDGQSLALFGHDRRGKPAPDISLRLYDLATRKQVWTSTISDASHPAPTALRFAADGKRLVTASLDVRVWDAKTGGELAARPCDRPGGRVDVSPDGKTVAVMPAGGGIDLWEWESAAAPRRLPAPDSFRTELVRFAPDGRTLLVPDLGGKGQRSTVTGYDTRTGAAADRLPTGMVRWFSVSPDGKTVATGRYDLGGRAPDPRAVVLWDRATNKEIRRLDTGRCVPEPGSWSADGKRFAARAQGRLWVWDVATGKPVGPADDGHTGVIADLAFAPDGRLFSAGTDRSVRTWDPATGKPGFSIEVWGDPRGIALSPDGTLLAVNAVWYDSRVFDAKTGKEVFQLQGHGPTGSLRLARFSADEQTLLTFADDGLLRTWDALTGKPKAVQRYKPEPGNPRPFGMDAIMPGVRAADLGPDANTLVIADGKLVKVIAADTGRERVRFEADPKPLHRVTVSADGKRLATLGDGTPPIGAAGSALTVWALAEGKPVAQWWAEGATPRQMLLFSPDGKWVVTDAHPARLQIWDAATGALIGTIDLPGHPIRAAFDGPGKRLAVGFRDTTILVLDVVKALKAK